MESSITEKLVEIFFFSFNLFIYFRITCFEDFFKFPNEEELRKKLTLFSDLEFLNQPENQTIQEFGRRKKKKLKIKN